jgi:hypothetical protein
VWLMPDGRLQCAVMENSANKSTKYARLIRGLQS